MTALGRAEKAEALRLAALLVMDAIDQERPMPVVGYLCTWQEVSANLIALMVWLSKQPVEDAGMTPTLEQEWVMACVSQERIRQDERWGEAHDPGDPVLLAVLMEEVGEVARALIDGWPAAADVRALREELIQVAAVAVKWAEAIERRANGCG